MGVTERFLRYVKVNTASDPTVEGRIPSAEREFDLARMLADELRELGLEGVRCDDKAYVYGYLPATAGYESAPKLGFIAHMDTAPDFCGENVQPIVHENYDGGDVELKGRTIHVADFPHLKKLAGRTLITADGTTLLGGDDKAGVAEIMTMLERLIGEGIAHGRVAVGFTPDEEVGAGADAFDVAGFGCDFAYTVDGGEEGGIDYENFNAAGANFTVNGFNVHPGSSKDTMINASLVAMEINSMLPAGDTPRLTEGYEGFFHLCSMSGNVERAELEYIVRDHSAQMFAARLELLRHVAKVLNEKYGAGTVELEIREQYRNMLEKIQPCYHIVENACAAIEEAGLKPIIEPIRGGTDGARLSFMGLPCPNLGTGAYAGHGPYEHATTEGMEKCVEILVNIVKRYAKA